MKRMKQMMKKVFSIALAAVLLVVLSMPASSPVYGMAPPILVYGNGIEVHDAEPSAENNTLFINKTQFIIISNNEDKIISLDSIEISGDDKSDFMITQNPASELREKGKAGDTTSFVIQCNATGSALKNARVKIKVSYQRGSDLEEDSISFPIKGGMFSGSGTQVDPYLISTADDLELLSELVNAGASCGGIYFKMTNDIALNSNTSNYQDWETTPPAYVWRPIGNDKDHPFFGSFDGGNHEVTGIYTIGEDAEYSGLFGYGSDCAIENLGVAKSMIEGRSGAGGIIGVIDGSRDPAAVVKNCYNKGIVNSDLYAGGIAGRAKEYTLIDNCYNEGKVSVENPKDDSFAGGIAGSLEAGTGGPVIQYCRNSGEVNGSGNAFVGGITGSVDGGKFKNAIVNSSNNTGSISLRVAMEDQILYEGDGRIGGITGEYYGGLLVNCGSTGIITAEAEHAENIYAGGLVGEAAAAYILNNYSTSEIEADFTSVSSIFLGGIAGRLKYSAKVNNYFAGNIIYTIMNDVNADNAYIGYAFGSIENTEDCVVAKNYYDNSQATGIATGGGLGMAEGITAAAMKLSTGDDTLLAKLNSGTASAAAIIKEKGYAKVWPNLAAKGGKGATPSAWFIESDLNSGYPQFDKAVSNGGSGHKDTPAAPQQVVKVNGVAVNVGTYAEDTENGRKVTTVTFDEKTLKDQLAQAGTKPTVTIPVNNGSDIVRGELDGQMVRDMEAKEAVLEIKTDSVQYVLPAAQIDIDAISGQVGENVALSDIKVQIQISKSSQDTVKVIEDAANKGSFALVVPPVEFEITCTHGDKTVSVSQFNNYVERTVAIPDGVDPAKITTGVVLDPDGTVHHVPTKIVLIAGKYYAKINSLTNSVYSVVWNPVEFTDTASHWAKAAINDMGSRMVIGGVGNGNFEPNRDITRAEFAAIVVRALGLAPGEGENSFTDVSKNSWYAGYVETAVSYGIISGLDKSTFAPDSKITREQAMTMTARAMTLTKIASNPDAAQIQTLLSAYGDNGIISGYAKQSVADCLKAGVVSGRTRSMIAPKENMTRAEVAVIVQKLLQKSGLI